MDSPLDGIRVLDLTTGMPGAVATMLLADFGADVVRVEPPDGDPTDTAGALRTWRRGKRTVRLDLDDEVDRATLDDLLGSADVAVVGLDPATALAHGLDPTSLRKDNDGLVYVALSGFGLADDRATPGLDALAAAELGVMVAAPAHDRDGPTFLGHPAIAYSTAMLVAIGTLGALRGRVATGHGDLVDVSLLDGVLAQFTMNWWTDRKVSFLSKRRSDGELDLGRTRMLVRRYRCADGRLIQVHSGAAGAFTRLMKVVGLAGHVSEAIGPVESASPLTERDLELLETLPDIFATRTADEWLEEIWRNEIAALPVLAPGECFDDPQVRHNDLIRTVHDTDLGPIDVVGPPIKLSRSPARRTDNLPPIEGTPGWTGSGLGEERGERLVRGPLDGVRVVEFATFFASPYANRFLRDLGAEIIKVEALSGDPMRSLPDPFEGVSRGKKSIAIDLKAAEARPVIEALLSTADVVQHNFRPGAAERLGIDDASARALNPDVIYGYAPGYGSTGPKSTLQSFAPLHSGFVGIHAEASGRGNPPMATFGNEDYYNGLLNAIGILAALVHKARTGQGQYLECAQLSSSVFVTSHWYRAGGALRSSLPELSPDQYGWAPHQRIYQCLEGYVCVYCVTPGQEAALAAAVLDREDAATRGIAEDLADRLVYEFFSRTAEEWVETLRSDGVPCAVVVEESWLSQFLRDERSIAAGRATPFDHQDHGAVSAIGRIVQLAGSEPCEPVRSPRLGEHTVQVLTDLGHDDESIAALLAAGVVHIAEGTT